MSHLQEKISINCRFNAKQADKWNDCVWHLFRCANLVKICLLHEYL